MTIREGNLEAPTRHAVDWKNPDFYDEAQCLAEMERIFDICHGCRRCVSLCQSFPNLFDLVDATDDGEVHGVNKADYWTVVDQCYLCDLCYLTKCPYVPPHAWNLDFPHTMLRAKAIKFRKGEVKASEKFLASTDVHGQFAGIPVVVQAVNAINRTQAARGVMESVLDVDRKAWMPELATKRFRWSAKKKGSASEVKDGQRSPGKVAIFATCYVNYNEPGIGHDLLASLEHNEIPYVIVEKESCCGMPKLELGDLEGVEKHKNANIPVLAKYAKEGWAIVSAVPSCTLMFKQEIPLLFPGDADVAAVQAHFRQFTTLSMTIAQRLNGRPLQDTRTRIDARGIVRTDVGAARVATHEIEPVLGTLADLELLARAAATHEVTIHCAVDHGADRWALETAALDAMIADAREARRPRLLIYTSGVWVYGTTGPRAATEDDALTPPAIVAKPVAITISSSDRVITFRYGLISNGASVCPMKMLAATERLVGPPMPIVRWNTNAKPLVMTFSTPQCHSIAESDPITMISGSSSHWPVISAITPSVAKYMA